MAICHCDCCRCRKCGSCSCEDRFDCTSAMGCRGICNGCINCVFDCACPQPQEMKCDVCGIPTNAGRFCTPEHRARGSRKKPGPKPAAKEKPDRPCVLCRSPILTGARQYCSKGCRQLASVMRRRNVAGARRATDSQVQIWKRMHANGMTHAEIARAVMMDEVVVRHRLDS